MRRILLIAILLLAPALGRATVPPPPPQAMTFTPFCNGADTARFTALIATIGANQATISLPYKSNPAQRCTVNSLTIPSNIGLDNTHGSGIKINSGQTLTITGPVAGPIRPFFYNTASGQGTITFSGNRSLGTIYPQWWGAVGDGIADDTAAFQRVLDVFKHDSAIRGGRIFVPAGVYNITGLTYEGSFVNSFVMQGATQGEGGTYDGPTLMYTGPAGGTLLTLKGANWCRFEDIQFHGNGLALTCVSVEYDSVRGVSSFDCSFFNCGFGGAVGVDSTLLKFGPPCASAEHNVVNCRFVGHSTAGTTYYGITGGGGNCKNYTIESSEFIGLRYGLHLGDSGFHRVVGCSFANNTISDMKAAGDQMAVRDCGSEGSAKFIDSAGASILGNLTIEGCYWAGVPIGNDFVIDYPGQLTMIGNAFYNNRAPTLKTFTVNTGTDVFTSTAHSLLSPVASVRVNVSSTGTLPAPLTANTNYYLRDVTTDTFNLAAIEGGAAIDITSTGSGTHSIYKPIEPVINSGLGLTSGAIAGSVISFNNTYIRPAGTPAMDYIPIYGGGFPVTSLSGSQDGVSDPNSLRGLQLFSFGDKSRPVDTGFDVNFSPRMPGHVTYLSAISAGAIRGKNLRGSASFLTAGSRVVAFNAAEPDAAYFIAISSGANETFWVTSKTVNGFTLNSSNATSTAVVDWILVR